MFLKKLVQKSQNKSQKHLKCPDPWVCALGPWGHESRPEQPWGHTRVPWRSGPRIQGSLDPRIQGSTDPRIHGPKDPGIQGSRDPRIQGPKDPRIQGSLDPRIQGSRTLTSRNPGIQGPNLQNEALTSRSRSWAITLKNTAFLRVMAHALSLFGWDY